MKNRHRRWCRTWKALSRKMRVLNMQRNWCNRMEFIERRYLQPNPVKNWTMLMLILKSSRKKLMIWYNGLKIWIFKVMSKIGISSPLRKAVLSLYPSLLTPISMADPPTVLHLYILLFLQLWQLVISNSFIYLFICILNNQDLGIYKVIYIIKI